jgi:integrase
LLAIQPDLRGLRDRALLKVAYDTLSRRSEVVSLRINDIEATRDKDGNETARILLRRSKTDQDLRGRWLFLKPSSYQCLMKWINEAKLKDGLIFRGVKGKSTISKGLCLGQVGRIYKKLARRAGLEASIVNEISSHSTRVGAAQDLLMQGASLPMIMTCGRWSKTDTVMKYIEATTLNMNTF